MLKEYQTKIPLPIEESYELFKETGAHILSWKLTSFDQKTGYIEWKQQFWALTGAAVVSVRLKRKGKENTRATVCVYKPMQIFDPVGICDKIFSKLDRAVQQKLAEIDAET